VFGAASESFSKKNINCTIEESLDRFKAVCDKALQNNIKVRGYVSCVLGCPYEGAVKPEKVLEPTFRFVIVGWQRATAFLASMPQFWFRNALSILFTQVLHVAQRLLEMGCYEVSLGDTIGTGAAGSTHKLLETVLKSIPADKLVVHFHDTYGQVSAQPGGLVLTCAFYVSMWCLRKRLRVRVRFHRARLAGAHRICLPLQSLNGAGALRSVI
jgi:hydroxymethylglutaryl-CoA lyase